LPRNTQKKDRNKNEEKDGRMSVVPDYNTENEGSEEMQTKQRKKKGEATEAADQIINHQPH